MTKHKAPERAPTCTDCGAFLQEIRIAGLTAFRCPWARDSSTRIKDGQISCDWPLGAKRVPGGFRLVDA